MQGSAIIDDEGRRNLSAPGRRAAAWAPCRKRRRCCRRRRPPSPAPGSRAPVAAAAPAFPPGLQSTSSKNFKTCLECMLLRGRFSVSIVAGVARLLCSAAGPATFVQQECCGKRSPRMQTCATGCQHQHCGAHPRGRRGGTCGCRCGRRGRCGGGGGACAPRRRAPPGHPCAAAAAAWYHLQQQHSRIIVGF
jgi:hypothetical protein